MLYTIVSMMIIMALITVMLALATMAVATSNKEELRFERQLDLDVIAEKFFAGEITTNVTEGVYTCRVYGEENKMIVLKGDVVVLTVAYTEVSGEKQITCYVYGEVE